MQIDKNVIEKIIGPMAVTEGEINVSLFIVSAKQPRLKKLNLDPQLSPEKRAEKLHKWAQQHRFVAVIEIGDQMFAHANADHAEKLQGIQDLSINGKKVTVKALTDEESEQLSAFGEAFEQYVLDEAAAENKPTEAPDVQIRFAARQFLASQKLVSDEMQMNYVIAAMKNIPGQVILNCLQKMSEARREADKQKKEDDRRYDIKEQQIKKDILKREITKGEVNAQESKEDRLEQHLKHQVTVHGGNNAA